MARMVPLIPRKYSDNSREDEVFNALRNALDDTYWVFHSFKLKDSYARPMQEIDFIVYNREKGILCLEVKSWANIKYHDGTFYGVKSDNGGCKEIPLGKLQRNYREGPYDQAENAKFDILDALKKIKLDRFCPVMSAVWWCSISRKKLLDFFEGQRGELASSMDITLSADDVKGGAKKTIENIYKNFKRDNCEKALSESQEKILFQEFLCPTLSLVCDNPVDVQRSLLYRLSDEQMRILDFLDGQRSIVINGTAGTGKTVVARQMAIRKAERGESVLFLCYNGLLRDKLKKYFQTYNNVRVETLAGLCKFMGVSVGEWDLLWDKIIENKGKWQFSHVVVDEGQDFGWDVGSHGADILEAIEESLLSDNPNDSTRSFAVFYDKHQLVQGEQVLKLPSFISSADCKLTLYRNCRNSRTVAESVMSLMGLKTYLLESREDTIKEQTKMYFPSYPNPDVSQYYVCLMKRCKELQEKFGDKDDNVVVISCSRSALAKTSLSNYIEFHQEGQYKNPGYGRLRYDDGRGTVVSIPIYTARTFKGLEADAVVLVDVMPEAFKSPEEDAARFCYTAGSRARMSLSVIVNWKSDDYLKLFDYLDIQASDPIPKSLGRKVASKLKAGHYFC